MIRYERRVAPAKLEVWGADEWPEWRMEPGTEERTVAAAEECVLLEGRLRLAVAGTAPVELEAGDWFALEPGTVCAFEALEPVAGCRRTGG